MFARARWFSAVVSLTLVGLFTLPITTVKAGPPDGRIVTLVQPNGYEFLARAWGDEWSNGMETIDGYTILLDIQSDTWMFAEPLSGNKRTPAIGTDGNLVVGRDDPGNLPRHLRPSLKPASEAQPSRHAPSSTPGDASLPVDDQKVLVILVGFQDRSPVGTTVSDWSNKVFGPMGSLRQYYLEVSFGNLILDPAGESSGTLNDGVVGWLTLPYAHPNSAGSVGAANEQIAHDAILAADPFVNFASFDTNSDGYISTSELHLILIIAGYETSYSSSNTCSPSIWAHNWYLSFDPLTVDGKRVADRDSGGYSQLGEWHCELTDQPGHAATIGMMVHEFGHDLGWPDLYDTDGDTDGIGDWGIMGTGGWNQSSAGAFDGDAPAHPDPWSRWVSGWLTPRQITASRLAVSIPQIETSPTVYQLLENPAGVDWEFLSHSGTGEYFLVENRQQVGFDVGLPGCGVLIWHIDESVVFLNTANANQFHRLVDLLQADGLFQLNSPDGNRGDAGDPFPGSQFNLTFNANSTPNSNLYLNRLSGVSVTRISDCNAVMTADLFVPSFTDVLPTDWSWKWVEALTAAGVTSGCGGGNFCPLEQAPRSQIAVLLLRARHGGGYVPPAALGIFEDVPVDHWAADWIEQLYNEGITNGCSTEPLRFCPESNVSRAEIAAFLLRARHEPGYTPPPAMGLFADVPVEHWASGWIESLYSDAITTGCLSDPLSFCPDARVTRAEMAAFLVRTFDLTVP